MKTILKPSLLPLLAAALFMPSANSLLAQDDSCDPDGQEKKTVKLKIRVSDNRPDAVMRNDKVEDTVHVCMGDTVEWMLLGQARKFFIEFAEGTPFADGKEHSNSGKVLVDIDGDVERGIPYKYDVGLDDGGVFDPHIVVD